MTFEQWLSVSLITVMMAAFVWDKLRYDVVAGLALCSGLLLGIIEPKAAFSGFSDDIVIIVASALVVSASIARTGVMDLAMRRLSPETRGPRLQLIILVVIVAVLSAFVKNIGALAIMIPVAIKLAGKSGVSPSMFLMPMSFASLLGGLMTQIGTSPNVIVSRLRAEITGSPFTMFDYTPVGAALTLAGVLFLGFFYWLLPKRNRTQSALNEALDIKNYLTEAHVSEQSLAEAKTVSALQKIGGGEAMITAILNAKGKYRRPLPDTTLKEGDILLIEGSEEALNRVVSQGKLKLSTDEDEPELSPEQLTTVEAVVGEHSRLIGLNARELALFDLADLRLLAVSRRGRRFTERLSEIRIQNGDVLVLQGSVMNMPDLLREWNCLPLVERDLKLGSVRNGLIPVAILLAAMFSTAFLGVPVAVGFFAAAVLVVVSGALPLRELYGALDAPILFMLAALIPVSDTLRTTGTTEVIAGLLSDASAMLPPFGAIALIMVVAMAVTPFLNNAATVLVMAPIAAGFAAKLGFAPDAFLMAVAIGAGCDFLTPIGHQCNTLVMGPGGYRFSDYWKLGLPLSFIVLIVAVPMLMMVWPI